MSNPDNDALLAVTALDGLDDDEPLCNDAGDAHWQRPPHNRVYLTVGAVRRLAARVRELEAKELELSAALCDEAFWKQEVAALRADRDRLDWLEAGRVYVTESERNVEPIAYRDERYPSLRAAIDAARKEEP